MKNLDKSSDEFGTPKYLFDALDTEFNFTLDVAATKENHKCRRFFTKEDNGLMQSWACEKVFCNPPYSNGMKEAFARKAYEETSKECILVVMILPTCTDQSWFHDLVRPPRVIRYDIQGRVKFDGGKTSARDSHMVLVFRNWRYCGWAKANFS